MEQTPPPLDAPPPVAPVVTSLSSRLFNVFATPGEVFESVARSLRGSVANWLVPAFILMVVSWVGGWLVLSQPAIRQQLTELTDQAIEKQIAKAKVSKDQADRMREQAAKFGDVGQRISVVAMPVLAGIGSPFLWGVILWLVGTKALKGSFEFMRAVEVAGLTNMIVVLESIVKTLLILATGNLFATPSLALLLKNYDPQNTVHTLLALVNVMTFWVLAVRAIGLAKLSGASFVKAAIWVFGLWAAWMGVLLGISLGVKALFGG